MIARPTAEQLAEGRLLADVIARFVAALEVEAAAAAEKQRHRRR